MRSSALSQVKNKRAQKRYPVCWRIQLRQGTRVLAEGNTIDLSASGIQVVSDLPLRIGQRIEVDVMTSPRSFFRATALVIRESFRTRTHYAYGMRFIAISDLDRQILRAGLDSLVNRGRKTLLISFQDWPESVGRPESGGREEPPWG